jgi:hypothetical protein
MTASVKVTCTCGAIYEMIQTKGPSRDRRLSYESYVRKSYSRGTRIMLDGYALYGVLTRIESNAFDDRR